jgi:hypothetical protein
VVPYNGPIHSKSGFMQPIDFKINLNAMSSILILIGTHYKFYDLPFNAGIQKNGEACCGSISEAHRNFPGVRCVRVSAPYELLFNAYIGES